MNNEKKYYINDEEITQDDFEQRLEDDVNEECENGYDDMLDDCCGDVVIGTLTYSPSYVLSVVDPIAYRCGLSEYVDSILSDYQYELERDNECTVNGNDYKIEELEEEEENA